MNKKLVGAVLIIVGIALIVWGYDVYDSFGSQVSRTVGGDSPMKAWVAMIGGAVCVVAGILRLR